MKTIISALLSTLIITLALAGNATAATTNTKESKASHKAAKANSKVLKGFNRSYKGASDVSWSMDKDAMIASFTRNGIQTNVTYNKNGSWFHTLTYYPADKTPQNIVDIMDNAYPKDDIRLAVKVEEGALEFYIVQLEGKTTIKKVSVYNGEPKLMEELNKSN